jgi:hypothetical protein
MDGMIEKGRMEPARELRILVDQDEVRRLGLGRQRRRRCTQRSPGSAITPDDASDRPYRRRRPRLAGEPYLKANDSMARASALAH